MAMIFGLLLDLLAQTLDGIICVVGMFPYLKTSSNFFTIDAESKLPTLLP
jgi:hypothetical protein